jgi:transposase
MVKHLRSREKKLVADVYKHFVQSGSNDLGPVQQTVAATGYSRRTVFRVMKEERLTGTVTSPKRPKKRGSYKKIDDFDETVIRNKFQEFYSQRRQLPTLKNLHHVLKEEIAYPGSIWLLRQTVKKLGFSWRRTENNRKVLIEKPTVVAQRMSFYDRKKDLEKRGFTLVYVDETWVDTSYTTKKCWQSEMTSGPKAPINRGQRLIIVHAGSSKGFVDGAQLVYKATSSTGDYHREMNGENFTKWIKEKLIPNLQTPSAVVMDNASYHSVQTDRFPTSSWKKADIQVNTISAQA